MSVATEHEKTNWNGHQTPLNCTTFVGESASLGSTTLQYIILLRRCIPPGSYLKPNFLSQGETSLPQSQVGELRGQLPGRGGVGPTSSLAKFFTGKVGKCRQEAKVLPGAMVCHCSMNKFDYMHAEGGLWRDWNNQNNGGEKIIPSRSKNLDWSFLGWGRGCKLKLNLNVNGSGFLW